VPKPVLRRTSISWVRPATSEHLDSLGLSMIRGSQFPKHSTRYVGRRGQARSMPSSGIGQAIGVYLFQNKRSFLPLNAVGLILPTPGFPFLSDSRSLPFCSSAVWAMESGRRSNGASARSMRHFSSLAMGNETCCHGRGWLVATSKHITHIIRPVLLFWTVSKHLLSKNRLYKPGQSDET
jgi:hypothetical protein